MIKSINISNIAIIDNLEINLQLFENNIIKIKKKDNYFTKKRIELEFSKFLIKYKVFPKNLVYKLIVLFNELILFLLQCYFYLIKYGRYRKNNKQY